MVSARTSTVGPPPYCVDVVERGLPTPSRWIRCGIDENLTFDVARLQTYRLGNWDTRVYDAFVLAAAVQYCDQTKRRPSTDWRRDFVLRVPVHDPDHWNSVAVSTTLQDALTLLTGDRWDITFKPRRAPALVPPQGNLELRQQTNVVIPFSDGLDSRAVAGLMELELGRRLIRVRLGRKSLNGRPPRNRRTPFASIPYGIRYGKRNSVETSARSRGFKFALLSGVAAYLSGAGEVVMSESGQGALGPVLAPVGQAYEDYRNHPIFTDRMTLFLSALLGHEVHYRYPRLWHTKAETVAEFVTKCPDARDWVNTRSCWQGQRHVSVAGQMRQCGTCAACILRRMSVHAAQLSEPEYTYVWEDLSAAEYKLGAAPGFKKTQSAGALYEYAIAGVLHCDDLASLLRLPGTRFILDRRAYQLSHSLGISLNDARRKLVRLLKKHAEEWASFVSSLGPKSFVTQWVERSDEHAPGGGISR